MPTVTSRIVRLEDKMQGIDRQVGSLEETSRYNHEFQKELSQTLKELNTTLGQIQVTQEGLQKSIEHIISSGKEDREEIRKKLEEHSGKFSAIKGEIKIVDDKTKLDIGRLAVQFCVFLLGGSGSFIVAMWVYINYLQKLATP